ncbi:MAG: molybdopterin molybdotransferase MoeA [Desulfuromonadales bacterium]|nr:molybdopterin molybdotransferase MoeA [Desulfuromonadales bacterium]
MLSYEGALAKVLASVMPLPPVEISLDEADGLVLAEAVDARWDMPPADNSAMDGFAFAWRESLSGTELTVIGSAYAGSPWLGSPGPAQAVRIMTGSPLPTGCDTVVPLEDVIETGQAIRLPDKLKKGQHVRRQGEEFRNRERLLDAGVPLYAGESGLLAAAGFARVRVHPAPRVALLSTGDELVELGQTPGPGQIVNSNRYLLSARLREEGCSVLPLGLCRDEPEVLARHLAAGEQADLILSTGGVSVGDRDYLREALAKRGFETVFWKVAIKPGKPVLFGLLNGRPLFGLPGNPAAAAATFELFVRPALRRLAGFPLAAPLHLRAILGGDVHGDRKRECFLWGRLGEEQGRMVFHPSSRQGSGQNRSLQGARALLPVPAGCDSLPAGSDVEVMVIRSL